MKLFSRAIALAALRVTVGGVLVLGAAHLLIRLAHHHAAGLGYPAWTHWLLGAAEILAGLLFMVPRTTRLGGWSLIVVLAVAAVLHAAAGEMPPLAFLVYVAAIFAVMAHADSALAQPPAKGAQ